MAKRKNNCLHKMSRYIVGSFFLTIGISIVVIPKIIQVNYLVEEDRKVENFMNNQNYNASNDNSVLNSDQSENSISNQSSNQNYVAVIEIPKINLKKGIYSMDNLFNSVDYGIEILKESEYPDKPNSNFILASHSGTSYISYFKDLDKLEFEDEITLYYENFLYKYRLINKYEVDKTGIANITRNYNKRTLTLITCRKNTNKQIIFICEEV